jgi:hypothetical protein
MEYLRDPVWQFVGAIFAFITISFMILFFKLQKNNKQLSYKIILDTEVLGVREELLGKLNITFQRKIVKNVRLFIMKFENNGNIPITSNDYEKPLTVHFEETATILSAEILKTNPNNLDGAIFADKNSFTITPILLNPKDSISVKLLLSSPTTSLFNIDTRIIGVGKIEIYKDIKQPGFYFVASIYLFIIIAGCDFVLARYRPPWIIVLYFCCCFVGMIMLVIGTIKLFRSYKPL